MKKIGFVCVMLLLGITSVKAQYKNHGSRYVTRDVVNATISAGLPIDDASEVSNVNLTGGLLFQWVVRDNLNLTFGASYSNFIGKDVKEDLVTIKYDDIATVLLGVGARWFFTQDVAIGIESGYGIGISPKENEGGFYYSPNLRYYFWPSTNLFLNYTSIANNGNSMSSVNLGFEFSL
jgi:hypothetical protein